LKTGIVLHNPLSQSGARDDSKEDETMSVDHSTITFFGVKVKHSDSDVDVEELLWEKRELTKGVECAVAGDYYGGGHDAYLYHSGTWCACYAFMDRASPADPPTAKGAEEATEAIRAVANACGLEIVGDFGWWTTGLVS
jgi:hypothetical protein